MPAGCWTWLEVAKLLVGAFTPAALAFLGIFIHKKTKQFEHIQWRSQKLIEKRISVYEQMAPEFNDILCYFTYVGPWKEFEPAKIVAMKRTIDKKIYINAPLFSAEFFSECMTFQNMCFETFNGWGQDARLKTKFSRRQQAAKDKWVSDWDQCFSDIETDPALIKAQYAKVMNVFSREIGVNDEFLIPDSGRIPANIR